MSENLPEAATLSLRRSMMALLASKCTKILLAVVTKPDLLLLTVACIALVQSTPDVVIVRRLAGLLEQALTSIAINTLMITVVMPNDPGLTLVNLLAVFMLGSALQHSSASGTAEYLLASKLSSELDAFGRGAVAVAWALAFIPSATQLDPMLAELSMLVTVDSFTTWLETDIPPGLHLLSLMVIIYFFLPFVAQFPPLGGVFQYAVFSVTSDLQEADVPVWAMCVTLWLFWQLETDSVTKQLALSAGAHMMVVMITGALSMPISTDPFLVVLLLLVFIDILEEGRREPA